MDSSTVDIYLFYFSCKVENENLENDSTIESNARKDLTKEKMFDLQPVSPFLLVKVCRMLLKDGLMLVIYGDGEWGEGQTRLTIFIIDTFLFQDLFRALLSIQGAIKASLLSNDTLNQIFTT